VTIQLKKKCKWIERIELIGILKKRAFEIRFIRLIRLQEIGAE